MRHYDLCVIGTGPAGQKAAIQAAKLGKSVVAIEKAGTVGGAQINTGTIPSKALREAAMHLTGQAKRGLFGESYRVKRKITVADLISVSRIVINNELDVVRDAFDRNGIDLIWGRAQFIDAHTVQVTHDQGTDRIGADTFVIAVGTRPAKPGHVPFDGEQVFCSDDILTMTHLPKNMIVVGGGVIGTEYACIFATLGVRVTLIEGRSQVLGFLDTEIAEAFHYHMRHAGVTLRINEKVEKIEKLPPVNGEEAIVQATLESGKKIKAQTLLYSIGRQGVCGELDLDKCGLTFDDRERLHVDEHYRTAVEHVYAVGDVIGFPALASTAMEQGRLAACHAFGAPTMSIPALFPFGVYSVPEISMVGKTEQQLTEEGVPYEAGVAQYKEIARGQLLGDDIGLLKLLIHQEDRRILGVHVIGTGATELIHIGQAVMAFGGTVDFFINNVFNFPTLAEAYKVAALNGANKIALV
ncbi:MAG: Si-specific NAD(P)(+) transhydrogenase [Planctomycetes bacterium]|nr:Si-specific NAD(P)(+) transhydrogenase [Planctomycetota bacterium]